MVLVAATPGPAKFAASSKELVPHTSAIAITTAVAFPAYQSLITACRINPATGANASRAGDCAAIGRLMTTHGTSVISNLMGYSILRVSRTFNDDDVKRARIDDWVYQQYGNSLGDLADQRSITEIIAHDNDWITAGSEMDAMRHTIARTGYSGNASGRLGR